MPNTPNSQTNSQSTQNYDISITDMYKHFVTGGATVNDTIDSGMNIGIDDFRGSLNVSVTSSKTKDLIASLNINPTATSSSPTPNTTTPTSFVQESRCHAFYRIMGFPVVSTNYGYYNPGLDTVKIAGVTRSVTLQDKITIASNVGTDFENISSARETWAAACSKVFSIPTSIEAGVLALTSGTVSGAGGVILRPFSHFFTTASSNPFDFSIKVSSSNQGYPITTNGSNSTLVGSQALNLNLFVDAFGNSITSDGSAVAPGAPFFTHYHIISPFIVDPRIDFSLWSNESQTSSGLSKRVAVPFVPNSTYLKTGATAAAQRPLIETIIRNRINQMNNTGSAGQTTQNAVAQIQAFKNLPVANIGDTTLSQIFAGTIFQTSQQDSLANYIKIIQSMVQKLCDAIHDVHFAQTQYYYLPQPSTSGPEGGGSVRNVIFTGNGSSGIPFVQNDFNLYFNQLQALMSSITTSVSAPNATPDTGAFSIDPAKLTFDASTSNSFGDLSTQANKKITNSRSKTLGDANNALQIIEMIMGEFSGFGLCDIIAIMASLNTMSINDVLGFLDSDAYQRAQAAPPAGLGILPSQSDIKTSLTNLAASVFQFYQIMDVVFLNYFTKATLEL